MSQSVTVTRRRYTRSSGRASIAELERARARRTRRCPRCSRARACEEYISTNRRPKSRISSGIAKTHPLEEGDLHAAELLDHGDADQVGGRPDGGADAAGRGGVGRHEHHAGAEAQLRRVDPLADLPGRDVAHGVDDAEADGEHHGRRGRVADPHRQEGADDAEGHQDPAGAVADRLHRHDAVGKALVQAVDGHDFGQHEAAEEEADDRVGGRREDFSRRPPRRPRTASRPAWRSWAGASAR